MEKLARESHPDNGIIPPLSWVDYLDYLGGLSSRAGPQPGKFKETKSETREERLNRIPWPS